jgi:hypothetical protein
MGKVLPEGTVVSVSAILSFTSSPDAIKPLDYRSIMAILHQCPARSGSSFLIWRNPDSSTEDEMEAAETLNIPRV